MLVTSLRFMTTDVPTILELIRELADYEHELDAVEATVESLSNTIAFAPPPEGVENITPTPDSTANSNSISPTRPARCLLLFNEQGQPAGLALYFYNYSTWRARHGIYLEDLYVRASERGKGYGRRLLAELAREVDATGGGRLEWSVLKWNEPSIRFYEDVIGARKMDEWVGMRVQGEEALRKLAGFAGLE
ncbi:Peroxygenase 1 [Diatrype stigma]|uniref:Peroxygenase 1 n=1 Tax=Diatrype stigma TaxID=117547 RepID=A0AAN9UR10_9PEZI